MASPVEVLTNASSPLTQIMAHLDEAARQLSRSGTTLYAVLELKKGASPEDIKKAYRFRPSLLLNPGIRPALNPSLSTLLSDPFLNPQAFTLGWMGSSSFSLWHGKEFRLGLLASIPCTHACLLHS